MVEYHRMSQNGMEGNEVMSHHLRRGVSIEKEEKKEQTWW